MASYLNDKIRVVRHSNAVAAGSTDITPSSGIDMQADGGYRGCLFIVLFGTLTTNQVTSIRVQQSSDDGSSDAYADLKGTASTTLSDDDDNQVQIVDICRPTERYLKCIVDRATANAVLDGIIAIQYGPNQVPTTHDSTTVHSSEAHVSPPEGTA